MPLDTTGTELSNLIVSNIRAFGSDPLFPDQDWQRISSSIVTYLQNNLTTTYKNVDFDTNTFIYPEHKPGRVFYDSIDQSLNYYADISDVTHNIGQETWIRIKNTTGSTLNNGALVYLSGASGVRPTVTLARSDSRIASGSVIGMCTHTIFNDREGYVTVFGIVRDLDTSAYTAGTQLYLSSTVAGTYTSTMPTAPNYSVPIGTVIQSSSTQGMILVNIKTATSVDMQSFTKDPTGFDFPENIIVSYSSVNRTITLTSSGGPFNGYWRGMPVTDLVNGWVSPPHSPGVTGSLFLYYNGSSYIWSSIPWEFSMLQIAYVYYDSLGTFRFALREVHSTMPWTAHREFHQVIGTYPATSGVVSGFVPGSDVATNRRPDVSQSVLIDEDIETTVPAKTDKINYSLLYLLTSSSTITINNASADIVPLSTGIPQYNLFSGGSWSLANMSNNYYMSVWLFTVPAAADSQSQLNRYLWVTGQWQSADVSTEKSTSIASLNLSELARTFSEFCAVARVILTFGGGKWSIVEANTITGTRFSQTSSASGNFLSSVVTDGTLLGIGTASSPLSIKMGIGSNLNADLLDNMNTGTSGTSYIPFVNSSGLMSVGGSITATGTITAPTFTAASNDFADALDFPNDPVLSGMCVELVNGKIQINSKRNSSLYLGIVSDTYSYKAGNGKVPVAVSGFVLAYTDTEYDEGTKLVPNKFGLLTKAFIWERPVAVIISTDLPPYWNKVPTANKVLVKVLN